MRVDNLQVAEPHPGLTMITERIAERSRVTRQRYLDRMAAARRNLPPRSEMPCGNFAHGMAGCSKEDKTILRSTQKPNIGIVTAYNDMLSAHQPYYRYPERLKQYIGEVGGVAQVAGGTPAMCDGVTQGQAGMDMSLFSRDVIALSVGVALSHNMFDGAFLLGICDKIVPGLLIGALSFGHMPIRFIPAGPMPSGLPNKEKARIRQQYAAGEVDRETLLQAESESYHSPGTCTFYGTANTNQMMVEIMGL
ncbi:MAG: dihydroxy-acid dehydratase, partial [Ketobacteraceae bacterium]|nr:dihydroxy-acid dehydratase [Ketobacteraceae bacterium]